MRISYCSSVLLIFLIIPIILYGQNVCSGNLGENIFTAGDFGTGSDNVIREDPGIAPGYFYQTNPPPNDGYYTITNNTGEWFQIWPTWLHIRDNSSDPNGYMMVVNANFSPGIFFEQTITGLCENTLYEFSADVINVVRRGVGGHILPNVSFLLDDQVRFTSGQIPQDEIWHKYGFTFSTPPGVTEMKLTLRNNAPGGIGNDLALDNISFRACGPVALISPDQRAELCKDQPVIEMSVVVGEEQTLFESYQWQISLDGGLNWEDIENANSTNHWHNIDIPGVYYYRYLLSTTGLNLENSKCRIVSDLAVIEVLPEEYFVSDTICFGTFYEAGGQSLMDPGDYRFDLIGRTGCDSIVYLTLDTLSFYDVELDISKEDPECYGESTGSIKINRFNNGTPPYQYSFNGTPTENLQFPNLLEGEYEIFVEDRFGCYGTTEINLVDPPLFWIDAGLDTTLQLGEEYQFNPFFSEVSNSFNWSPALGLDCSNCEQPNLVAIEDQTYKLSALNDKDCIAVDSIKIKVDKRRDVFIPNAFSPNGDLFNDFFSVEGFGQSIQSIVEMKIFDRWGNLLFVQENFQPGLLNGQGWDGKNSGETLNPGVYVYLIKVLFLDGLEEVYSGAVTLF